MDNANQQNTDGNDATPLADHPTPARGTIRKEYNNDVELDSVVTHIADLFASGDDDIEDEGDYRRTVTIEFPDDASILYDISHVEVPIRMVLDRILQEEYCPAADVAGLRDDYYGGDREEDHDLECFPGPTCTWEERAELQVARKRSAGERANARARVEARRSSLCSDEDLRAKFPNELAAIEIERELIVALLKVVEARWQVFVLERDRLTEGQANLRREELFAEASRIRELKEGPAMRMDALRNRFYALKDKHDHPA